ncbi:MAG: NosD domain-containing protein [Promethearchaeota archaeon]
MKKLKNCIIFTLFASIILMPINFHLFYIQESSINNETEFGYLNSAGSWVLTPFKINPYGTGDYTWIEANETDWCSGAGTELDPWIIENVTIDSGGLSDCLEIGQSDDYFIIRNCTFKNSDPNDGLYMWSTSNGIVEDCTFFNNDIAVYISSTSQNNTIQHNYFYNNTGINVRLSGSSTCINNTVYNNEFINRLGSSIFPTALNVQGINNKLINNTVDNFFFGVNLDYANQTIIKSNTFISGTRGISNGGHSFNATFFNNTIKSTSLFGVSNYGNGSLYYRNRFINNQDQYASDYGHFNRWDNGVIGNYWDDYGGADLDDNGIGDSAYGILGDAGTEDRFPIWDDGLDLPKPIYVNNNWTETVSMYNYVSGSGTWGDPYLIEDITIDAQNSGSGILIENTDEYFIIRNCTIYDTSQWNGVSYDAGIKLYYTDNGTIYNNTIYDTEYAGIYLYNADNNTIYENILYQNDIWGIDNHWCFNNRIINNTVSANFVDIGFYNCENMTLRDNQMQLSGFYFRASSLLRANSHYIPSSNVLNGKILYYYLNQDYLSSPDFQNAAQIILVNCHNSTISDFEFDHGYRTISLYYSHDNTVQNCNFTSNNDNFIQLVYSEDNIIQNNHFMAGDSVVLDDYSNYNIIRDNEFFGSGNAITVLEHSTDNQIYDNMIDGATRGVYLISYANSNLIFGNNISDITFYGVYVLGFSSLNQVYDNIITNCAREGIRVERSDSNVIYENRIMLNELGILINSDSDLNGCYNNTFLSNVKHAQDDGVGNFWNITTIGNYWDNYTGVDANDNLVGDIAHPIIGSANSFDFLPIWEDGDDLGPIISITSPSIDSYHSNPPTIQVSITDIGDVNETWYTVIGSGINHTFTGTSFEVDLTSWTNHIDGSIIIRTYANDTNGNLAFADLSINKDTISPEILINEPLDGTEFGDNPPSFNLTIDESNISHLWFKINDSSMSHFVSGVSGNNVFVMDSSIWDAILDGDVLITFYVNDTVGHSGTISVTIIKDTSTPSPGPAPGIPGYDLVFLISIISIFSVIIIAKRRKLLN